MATNLPEQPTKSESKFKETIQDNVFSIYSEIGYTVPR